MTKFSNEINRNNVLLQSFTAYCNDNPDDRFWQALSNWSGYHYLGYVESWTGEGFQDLWHKEGK